MTFKKSMAIGPHHLLNQLVGEWEGVTKTWFEPVKLGDAFLYPFPLAN
jgi:hypothetical protein